MPKRKAAQSKDAETDSTTEKKEGGPLERKRAFMRQRGAILRPRQEAPHTDADEGSAPEPPSPRPGKKQS